MSMCDPNYWDTVVNGVNPGDKEFADLLNILDFPLESLDGDELDGEWDAKFQSLGPIPLDTLTMVNQGNAMNNLCDIKVPKKELPKQSQTEETRGPFRTPSPVSVLESSGSCSSGKGISVKSELVIPVRPRSKRAFRPALGTAGGWRGIPPITTTKKKTPFTGKFVGKFAGKVAGKRKMKCSEEIESMEKKPLKKCLHCEVTKTPQWREGPNGPKTLCNACGVRFRSGRLFPEYRPAASPTFVPMVHSNSHKKVVEMRQKVGPGLVEMF